VQESFICKINFLLRQSKELICEQFKSYHLASLTIPEISVQSGEVREGNPLNSSIAHCR